MKERKAGTLKSGRSGKTVKSRKQAIAIGLSEARKEGKKAPSKKTGRKSAKKKTKSVKKSKKSSRKLLEKGRENVECGRDAFTTCATSMSAF